MSSLRRTQPTVEALEDRTVPTTYFIFDFTPDSGGSNFVDTFRNTRTSQGYAPNFLDFDGDRRITMTDVNTAAQRIAGKVWSHFSNWHGSNAKAYYGDISSNSNWGKRWIDWGRQYSGELVMTMYFGGTSSVFGRAPLASDGYNVEGAGMTYTQTIANWLIANKPSATAQDFVDAVASTAAHEFGHMLGLRHATSGSLDNLMNTNRNRQTPSSHRFLNASVNTEGGSQQNAFTELTASFRGQRTMNGSVTSDSDGDEFLETESGWLTEWSRSYTLAEGRISSAGYDAAVSRLGALGASTFGSFVDQAFVMGTPMSRAEMAFAANLGGDVGSYDFNGLGEPDVLGPGSQLPEELSPEQHTPHPAQVTAPPALTSPGLQGAASVALQRVRGRTQVLIQSHQGSSMRAFLGPLHAKVRAWLQDLNEDGILDLVIRTKRNGRTFVRTIDGVGLTQTV